MSVTNITSEVTYTLNHEKVVSFFRAPPPHTYIDTYIHCSAHRLVQAQVVHQIHYALFSPKISHQGFIGIQSMVVEIT